MKVLWFSLTPCGSVRRQNGQAITGGWMISLEDELKKQEEVDLSVAFISESESEDFEYDGVHYYPMLRQCSKNPVKRVLDRKRSLESVDREMLPVMLEVVRRAKPDLIHIHGTEERFGLIAKHVKDIPIVFSIQGLIAPFKEKFFSGMSRAEVSKYEPLYDKLRNVGMRDDYRSFCFRAKREIGYLREARYIMGRTFWDRDITLGLNPKRRYFVVNEMLRKPFYGREWKGRPFEGRKLTLVSTISGGIYKGFETVLRTAYILKEYTGLDFEWKIAGYSAGFKWTKIASKIARLDYRKLNIVLMGRVGAEKLSETLEESDIYVHVSHIENSPNSVCEAMLVGMPIVASFAGGTATLVENGKEGVLVQDGDPYVLAGAITELVQDYEKAKAMGAEARKKAHERHDGKNIVAEVMGAYREILKPKSTIRT